VEFPEAIRREADDPLVVKLNEYRSPFSPCSQCGGLYGPAWLIDYCTHRMLFSERHDVPRSARSGTEETAI